MARTSLPIRTSKHPAKPLVCGVRGLAGRYTAPSSIQGFKGFREAALVMCQYMRQTESKSIAGVAQESDGTRSDFTILAGEMHRA